jgi:hypothetical protein
VSARLSAIDALVRGFANLRANWELILAQLLALFLAMLLAALSIVPLVLALGVELTDIGQDPWDTLARFLDPALWLSGSVLTALGLCLVVGTAALAVYSWFQAGVFGVLVAGDRQAGEGAGRPWALFRAFSWGDFAGWAGRGLIRFFVWYNLYLLISTLLVALYGLLVIAALRVGIARGPAAGVGLGCAGLLPLVALSWLCSLWVTAAKADLARESSGALESWNRGARVVSSRLGAAALLFLLFFAASAALGMLLFPLQMASELGARGHFGAYLGTQLFVTLLQWLLGSFLGLVYGASFVALVRGELPDAAG